MLKMVMRNRESDDYMESRGDWKDQDGVYAGEVATMTLLQKTPFSVIFERFLGFDSVRYRSSNRGGRGWRRK